MVQQNGGEFYKLTEYGYERFDAKGYTNLSLKAEGVYRARPEYWQKALVQAIDRHAAVSRKMKMPRITTECWGVVDYKDWPLLKWDWVKDLCALGAQRTASKRPVARDRDQQLLQPIVCGHVERQSLAPAIDSHHQVSRHHVGASSGSVIRKVVERSSQRRYPFGRNFPTMVAQASTNSCSAASNVLAK